MTSFEDPLSGSGEDWRGTIRARLFQQRIVVLSGVLDDAAANQCSIELMTLDANGDGSIQLQVDSGDGSLDAALALMDVVELLGVPLHATAIGQMGGPALGVLALANHRSATPNVRFHCFEPQSQFEGHVRDVQRWAELRLEQWRIFCVRMASAMKCTEAAIRDDLAGTYFSAQDALAYGLLDEIARPDAQLYRLPGRPIGFGPR